MGIDMKWIGIGGSLLSHFEFGEHLKGLLFNKPISIGIFVHLEEAVEELRVVRVFRGRHMIQAPKVYEE